MLPNLIIKGWKEEKKKKKKGRKEGRTNRGREGGWGRRKRKE